MSTTASMPQFGYFPILSQPDELTCGPTCLHALYKYYGRDCSLEQVISEVEMLPEGGTLAVYLALHAIKNGFDARIYTCDLQLFDLTWFPGGPEKISQGLLLITPGTRVVSV